MEAHLDVVAEPKLEGAFDLAEQVDGETLQPTVRALECEGRDIGAGAGVKDIRPCDPLEHRFRADLAGRQAAEQANQRSEAASYGHGAAARVRRSRCPRNARIIRLTANVKTKNQSMAYR